MNEKYQTENLNKNIEKISDQELIIEKYNEKEIELNKIIEQSKIEMDELTISIDEHKLNLSKTNTKLERTHIENLKLSYAIDNCMKKEKTLAENLNKNKDKILE